MPLARANTARKNSRSPAPPPSFQGSSQRPFLPPAHYAAAGGMSYSEERFYASPSSPSPAANCAVDRTPLVPISYPSQSMTSDSLFEFKPTSDSRFATASPTSRGKRQSTLGNLPLLEAHLLPSLRDTIDRMTRPPSSVSTSTILPSVASGLSNLHPPSRSSGSFSPSFSPVSSADILRSPAPQPHTASKSSSSSTPKSTFIPQFITTPGKDPSQGKQKSALKSALRSPTPKLSTLQAPVTDLSFPSGDSSLRPGKSIIAHGRKTPTQIPPVALISPNDEATGSGMTWHGKSASKTNRANDKPPPGRTTRARSRTDPGAPPNSLSLPSAVTPQPNSFVSGLPRPPPPPPQPRLTRFGRKDPMTYHAIDSSSELEDRYEMEGADRRKLVVTNATIVSSSSSESDVDVRTPDKRTRLPVLSDKWNQTRGRKGLNLIHGLGFDLEDDGAKHVVNPTRDDDDELSVYDDEEEEESGSDLRSVAFFHSSSQADDSMTSDDSRKRREALLGIVDGLDLGLGSPVDDRNEESDYCGQEGLAISGSGDAMVDLGGARNLDGHHTTWDNCEDGMDHSYKINPDNIGQWSEHGKYRRGDGEKPTQSMPILVVSTEDNDRRQGRVDPGQRSPSHRSASQPLTRPSFLNPSRSSPPSSSPRENVQRGEGVGNEMGRRGRKSPSRSPVIRQSAGVSMSTALRRHSFYEDGAPMPSRPNMGLKYSDRGQNSQVDDPPYIDTSLAESSYAAAARERKAFGIPPSESDEVYQREDGGVLSHATSDLSSVGSTLWHEDCEELSMGAEELFRKLSGSQPRGDRNSYQVMGCNYDSRGPSDAHEDNSRLGPRTQHASPPSGFEKALPDPPWTEQEDNTIQPPPIDRTWQSSLPQHVYQSLRERHGEMEMKRQEVIWNFRETEELFINRLLSMVRLFIRPLRAQNSNTWITGVPLDVARLLDWVEDIANFHRQILSVLQTTRHGESPVIEVVAEPLRNLVPRLEVYQPYLVRLEEVIGTIAHLMNDQDNDFGEFVKIQERASIWSLRSFVMEPQTRLQQYPVIFRQLLDVTPKDHPDYLSTFSLLHSTNFVIRVMNEVQNREDEYDLVKDISTRLQGFPSTMQLARRERRLLAHGLLQYIDSGDFACTALRSRSSAPSSDVAVLLSEGEKAPKGSRRLVDAINDWDTRRSRSASLKSNSSSSTAMSFQSYETMSSNSTTPPITPSSDSPFYCRVASPSQSFLEDSQYSKSGHSHMRSKHPLAASPMPQQNETLKPIPIHAFVFTDIIVLAVPVQNQRQKDRQWWQVLDQVGVARILGITEKSLDSGPQVVLDLLPVKALGAGVILDGSSILSVDLELPGMDSLASGDFTRQKWLEAFHQCFQFTLGSLAFPSVSGHHLHGPNSDLTADTEQTILSILASGLPLPKSPSAQVNVAAEHHENDKQQEREERGWWSLRFQQVLRELQRQALGTWTPLTN